MVFHMENVRIVRRADYFDTEAFMAQLHTKPSAAR